MFGGRPGPGGPQIRIPTGGRRRGGRGGPSSIVVVIIVALGLWIFAGVNPIQVLEMLVQQETGGSITTSQPQQQQRTAEQTAQDDERGEFMSVVLADTETTWDQIFAENDSTYRPPTLVIYSGFTQTSCGLGNAATGPFYCPADEKIYIDLSFFDLLDMRLGAPGDFAQAYVLAHEVGHHVQKLTGVLERSNEFRQRAGEREANAMSVRVELQADCYAGVWANAVDNLGFVEEGDIDEARGAASAVGDDGLQRRQQGYVVPETFNHGTAEQRSRWFRIGYVSGNPADCDTLNASDL